MNRRHCHLQKNRFFNAWIFKKSVGFKMTINKHGVVFLCNIRSDPVLVMLLLEGYHLAILHVKGNWLSRDIEDKISIINFNKNLRSTLCLFAYPNAVYPRMNLLTKVHFQTPVEFVPGLRAKRTKKGNRWSKPRNLGHITIY